MPLSGNRLGSKSSYGYLGDNGVSYRIKRDPDLVPGASGLDAAALGQTKPSNLRPRGVYVQASVPADTSVTPNRPATTVRKFIICNPTSTLYSSDEPQEVTIDGLTFTSTGRKGEQLSFI